MATPEQARAELEQIASTADLIEKHVEHIRDLPEEERDGPATRGDVAVATKGIVLLLGLALGFMDAAIVNRAARDDER